MLIQDDRQLLHICRYIHANPVKHGFVKEIGQWPYSNYFEFIGSRSGEIVDRDFVEDNFQSPAEYKEFVLDYLKSRHMPLEIEDYLKKWGEVSNDQI